jgi:hypothetical protein
MGQWTARGKARGGATHLESDAEGQLLLVSQHSHHLGEGGVRCNIPFMQTWHCISVQCPVQCLAWCPVQCSCRSAVCSVHCSAAMQHVVHCPALHLQPEPGGGPPALLLRCLQLRGHRAPQLQGGELPVRQLALLLPGPPPAGPAAPAWRPAAPPAPPGDPVPGPGSCQVPGPAMAGLGPVVRAVLNPRPMASTGSGQWAAVVQFSAVQCRMHCTVYTVCTTQCAVLHALYSVHSVHCTLIQCFPAD